MILFQADSLSTGTGAEVTKQTLGHIIVGGGIIMIPLGLLLILALIIFIERLISILSANKDPKIFMATVRNYVKKGDLNGALTHCDSTATPFARMIKKGIKRLGSPISEIQHAIEAVGNLEIYRLEKRLAILATIAGAAPMIGFLGTVSGMIAGFNKIGTSVGPIAPADLASPIATAMVTTAGGLVVGIIAYIGYNTLVNMVGSVIHKMEATSTDFVDLLQEPSAGE